MTEELKGVKTDHLDKECPAFKQGCPFKSVRTDEGKRLAEPVESIGDDEVR